MKRTVAFFLLACLVAVFCACAGEGEPASSTIVLVRGNARAALGDKADDALMHAFGEFTVSEAGACNGSGDMYKLYNYGSFQIKTEPDQGAEYIYEMMIVSDGDGKITTDRGVTVGSTAEEVKTACGSPASESVAVLVYSDENGQTEFHLTDSVVTRVVFRKS